MSRTATIGSLAQAFAVIKEMASEAYELGADYREAGRRALAGVLEAGTRGRLDHHLEEMARRDEADRRNGCYRRRLLSELGWIELGERRTPRFSAGAALRACARRAPAIDRLILGCFVFGVSTRKVAKTLLPLLGTPVSRVAKTLDAAVEAFHARKLSNAYQVLMLDGVVLTRKTGAGSLKRPVLVALGLRPDGNKEIIDFRLATAESQAQWELFLSDLYRRGLEGRELELIRVDGGAGLLAALPVVYPGIPVQRCWAHQIRDLLDKVRAADRDALKRDLHKIMKAKNRVAAWSAAARFARRWRELYPKAVACLRNDLDELLACFRLTDPKERKAVRATNAIERRFREVRRRTRPMGVFAGFTHENQNQGISAPFPLTQNS